VVTLMSKNVVNYGNV